MVDRLKEGAIFVKIAPLDYKGLYNAIYCIFFHFLILDVLQNLQGNYLKWPLSICEFLPYFNSRYGFQVCCEVHLQGTCRRPT